jgi:hypothetical protein
VRAVCVMLFPVLIALPGLAQSASPETSPSTANAERNDARWADWEAQGRIAEGDYDGAVQAKQQADAVRAKADREELAARAAKHP